MFISISLGIDVAFHDEYGPFSYASGFIVEPLST